MAFPISTIADDTQLAAALKTLFSGDEVMKLTYKDNPDFALTKKWTKFTGDSFKEPLIIGNVQGLGSTVALAQANQQASIVYKFLLTRSNYYASVLIGGEAIDASADDKGAFFKISENEIARGFDEMTRHLAIMMYGDGTGVIGTIGSITGAVITLSDLDQVTNFSVGMSLDSFTDTGGLTQHTNGIRVTVVDRQAGKITLAATTGSPANGDVLCRHGDLNTVLSGMGAWMPATAPVLGSDSFFGTDRGADPSRLAGVRSSQTTVSIEEALINGVADAEREGAQIDYIFMNFTNYRNLVKQLMPAVRYVEVKPVPEVGFTGIKVVLGKTEATVLPDRNSQSNTAWAKQMNTWTLRSAGDAPKLLDQDGMPLLRSATADAVEARLTYRAQLGCSAPGFNARITLS